MSKGVVLVTGSAGLVGSECVRHFARRGHAVQGIDSNARREFFGRDGDTRANLKRLAREVPGYSHYPLDIRDRPGVREAVRRARPSVIIHAAAQPSHDLAALRPFDDFEVNAVGTLNLLEACRQHCPEAPFIFLSTNKVYGDAPNELPLAEKETRFDYQWERRTACDRHGDTVDIDDEFGADPVAGINERMRVDASTHSLFGCSKLAADVMVQEYGRYHGLPTVCFRAGCLTGGAHAGAEQHGFLAYLARCIKEGRPYRVYGYKGKQVRDNLHAVDVASACEAFASCPTSGDVYNLGGGRPNSLSVLEAICQIEDAARKKLAWEYVEQPRRGDHVCYISDTSKFRRDYPEWKVTRSLPQIIEELCSTH